MTDEKKKKKKKHGLLSHTFIENHAEISEDEAADLIVKAEQKIREFQEERKVDARLAEAQRIVKDLGSAYSDAIKFEKAKIEFLLEKIEDITGGNINPHSSL